MPRRLTALFVILAFLTCVSPAHAQECILEEEERTIKTYPFSDPNPLPSLVKRPAIYPYGFFDRFSHEGKDRPWKVVRLENDFIEVLVLPEAGGKVYGAVEKSTGRPFIYMNDVMKFRQIAMRGPWTSGGIEFNFGLMGHAPSTASPVDYALQKDPDGSVRCIVGCMDLPSRTRWSVAITVSPGKAFFETRVLWYNPTPFHQSYYAWMNSAVAVGDDLQYFYPGRFVVPHGYDTPQKPWPVDDQGRDLSWYRNNDFGGSKSYFVIGDYENFFGGYWHGSDFGFGHFALYDDMPGKKMWIWALSRQGGIWEQLLTDTAGQYCEPQAGRLYSQSDHAFFAPYTADTWQEILFPFKEIGGLVQASPHAALNAQRDGNVLDLRLCPLQRIDEELAVTLGGREVYQERLSLQPMEIWKARVDLPPGEGKVRVRVGSTLEYCDDPDEKAIHRPIRFHRPDERTPEGLFLAGEFLEKRREYEKALEKYLACLEREPLHVRAMTRIAELYGRRGAYEKGRAFARRALSESMYDAGANYVYGVLSLRTGDLVDAKETLGWAARSMAYRSNAYTQLAEINLLEKHPETALPYAKRALDFNRYNLRAHEVQAIALRRLKRSSEASACLKGLIRLDPLNHLARFEQFLLSLAPEDWNRFQSGIRHEFPHETYLELAIAYAALNMKKEAVWLLKGAPEYATIFYWLAWLTRDDGEGLCQAWLDQAGRASSEQVFPFREESIPIFQWAMKARPDDWKPRYYLGLILWAKGRIEEAKTLFAACGEADFPPLHLILGYLDLDNATAHFQKALALDEGDWRNWHHLAHHLNQAQRHKEALDRSQEALNRFPDEVVLAMDRARALYGCGNFSACLELLAGTEFLPYEGGWEAHNLFERSQVHLAMERMENEDFVAAMRFLQASKAYPERLGTGKPFNPDYRLQDFLIALCREGMGKKEEAAGIRQSIREYTTRNRESWGRYPCFGLLTLEDLGDREGAEALQKALEAGPHPSETIRWLRANREGDEALAKKIEEHLLRDPRSALSIEVLDFLERWNP